MRGDTWFFCQDFRDERLIDNKGKCFYWIGLCIGLLGTLLGLPHTPVFLQNWPGEKISHPVSLVGEAWGSSPDSQEPCEFRLLGRVVGKACSPLIVPAKTWALLRNTTQHNNTFVLHQVALVTHLGVHASGIRPWLMGQGSWSLARKPRQRPQAKLKSHVCL